MITMVKIIIELVLLILILYSIIYDSTLLPLLEENKTAKAMVPYAIFFFVIDLIRRIFTLIYSRRVKLGPYQKDNLLYGVDNITKLLLTFGFIFAMLTLFGINVKTLLTSLSIVAAAIAIITREYINDFNVGLYFGFSKDFEINDYIKFGEQKGKIIELKMLKMKLLNDDDDLVIIPNSKVYNNEIINYTKRDIRLMSVDFQVDIKTVHNIELLEQELIDCVSDFEEYIEPNSFNLRIVSMAKDAIDFKFQYTLERLDQDLQRQIRRKTVRQIFSHISKKNG